MAFVMNVRRHSRVTIELDLVGEVLEAASGPLRSQLSDLIVVERPEVLLISLARVTAMSSAGVHALMFGYTTAVEHGTSYRVRHACGGVRRVLRLRRRTRRAGGQRRSRRASPGDDGTATAYRVLTASATGTRVTARSLGAAILGEVRAAWSAATRT